MRVSDGLLHPYTEPSDTGMANLTLDTFFLCGSEKESML